MEKVDRLETRALWFGYVQRESGNQWSEVVMNWSILREGTGRLDKGNAKHKAKRFRG